MSCYIRMQNLVRLGTKPCTSTSLCKISSDYLKSTLLMYNLHINYIHENEPILSVHLEF